MKRLILPLLAAALALSACETPQPTAYGPAAGPQAVGFSDYKIEPGRFRITFQGGRGALPQQVSSYALRRAAELTLAEGYDWFQVAQRSVQQVGGDGGPRVGIGLGGGNYGWHSGVGASVGTSFNLGGGPMIVSSLEVVMGHGHKPPAVEAYDAHGVMATLAPAI